MAEASLMSEDGSAAPTPASLPEKTAIQLPIADDSLHPNLEPIASAIKPSACRREQILPFSIHCQKCIGPGKIAWQCAGKVSIGAC
jgi:hypothetical protein